MDCIEGEPEVSSVSVHPGKKKTHAINGMNSESKQTNEGEVTFDIRFYMVTPDDERIKVIVNVEAQKDMLATLFSEKLDANTKKELLQQKHQMVMMRDLEGGIHTMCNVGEGVWERAEAAGELKGVSAMVKSLRKFDATDQQIIAQMMEELGLTEAEAKDYFDKVN